MLVKTMLAVNILRAVCSLIVTQSGLKYLSEKREQSDLYSAVGNEIDYGRDMRGRKHTQVKTKFLIENVDSGEDEDLYFLILVYSKPENFLKRRIIRDTWGSVKKYKIWKMKVIFVMGKPGGGSQDEDLRNSDGEVEINSVLKSRSLHHHDSFFQSKRKHHQFIKVDSILKLLELESDLHGDILLGNFDDTPGNETEKRLFGFNWLLNRYQRVPPKFVLKMEDNVFAEIFHLFNFVSAVYGPNPEHSLICDVIPSGTFGHKQTHERMYSQRKLSLKLLPKYCSGSAYLITPDLLREFVEAREELPPSFQNVQEDLVFTGLIREQLQVSPVYLNLRYTYELSLAQRWLNNSQPSTPLPFLFVVQTSPFEDRLWPKIVKSMWKKSIKIQKDFEKMQSIL